MNVPTIHCLMDIEQFAEKTNFVNSSNTIPIIVQYLQFEYHVSDIVTYWSQIIGCKVIKCV